LIIKKLRLATTMTSKVEEGPASPEGFWAV